VQPDKDRDERKLARPEVKNPKKKFHTKLELKQKIFQIKKQHFILFVTHERAQ
jgi:hypothetical protein